MLLLPALKLPRRHQITTSSPDVTLHLRYVTLQVDDPREQRLAKEKAAAAAAAKEKRLAQAKEAKEAKGGAA